MIQSDLSSADINDGGVREYDDTKLPLILHTIKQLEEIIRYYEELISTIEIDDYKLPIASFTSMGYFASGPADTGFYYDYYDNKLKYGTYESNSVTNHHIVSKREMHGYVRRLKHAKMLMGRSEKLKKRFEKLAEMVQGKKKR